MALNLGFSGFRRGSYDFYKTSWKYLNDASTRGGVAVSGIEGVLIPAGTSTVYDQQLGTNIRRPFLHVRYRASQTEDRRYKNWITGSAGGAYTTNLMRCKLTGYLKDVWLLKLRIISYYSNNKIAVVVTLVELTGVIITFINYIILYHVKNKRNKSP